MQTQSFNLEITGSTETVKALELINKMIRDNNASMKDMRKAGKEGADGLHQLLIEQEKNRQAATKLRKELKDQVKAFNDLNDNIPKDSIIGLGREVSKLTSQFKLLTKEERENAKGKELQKKIVETKTQFDTLNRSIGDYRSSIGDYRGAIAEAGKGLQKFGAFALGAFGVGSAMSVASSLINGAKQTITEFNTAIVNLGNDTTITNNNLKELTKIAIDLSGGKLGTSATDITSIFGFLANASPALADNVNLLKEVAEQVNILSKSEGANAELVSGAVTTAAQNFNISLSESARIVDTLAHATDQGKAKLPELAEAIKEGGVVAGQVGIPLKEYLDIIEATSKVGLRGTETAGKLNKVLSVLAKTGDEKLNPALHPMSEILNTLDERFGATAGSADALQKTTELFSSKNAAFVLTLIQQKDVLAELNSKQVENNGALNDAIKNADTLKGKVAELHGEWDKLVLSIDSGSGAVSHFFKFWAEGATGFIRLLRGEFRSSAQEAFDKTISDAFARGIEHSILGDLNENFAKAKAAAENLFKPILDEAEDADKKLKEFSRGTLGFISEEISRLNKVLQNTTSETVISITTKQIFELQKQAEKLQLLIDKATIDASGGRDSSITAPLPGIANIREIAFGQPKEREDSKFGIDFEQQQNDARNLLREEDLAKEQQYFDAKLEQQRMYNESVVELVNGFGEMFESLFDSQKDSAKDVLKQLLLITLKFAEAQVNIALQTAITKAQIEAIASGIAAPVALAKAAAQIAISKALVGVGFGILRGIVSNFEEGGIIKDGVPYTRPGTSDNVLIHAKKGEVVLNEKQQAKIKHLAGDGIFSQAGVKGFRRSATNNKVVMQNNNNVTAISNLDPSSIDQLSRSVADAIVNKNREVERKQLAGIK